MSENNRKVIKVSRKKFTIGVVVLVIILIVIAFGALGSTNSLYGIFQLLSTAITILVGLAVIYFIWGVVQSILATEDEQKKKGRSKVVTGLIGFFVVIAVWGVIFLLTNSSFSLQDSRLSKNNIPSLSVPELSGGNYRYNEDKYYPDSYDNFYNKGYGNPSISDTREFLKTSYSSEIKTKDVSDIVKDVKNSVKGADGRIDSLESSEKYGYISFVVPKSKFEAFRDEIESLTHEKLYTESISSKNLLTQKQGIEEQETDVNYRLTNIQTEKEKITNEHKQKLNTINSELARIKTELTSLRVIIKETTDPLVLVPLRNQETLLITQETAQKKLLSAENTSYSNSMAWIESSKNEQEKNLANVNKQDDQFADNIETVNGSVRITWISMWQMAKIFSPIHPTFIIIILGIVLGIFLNRKGKIPKVEFE